MPNGRRNQWSGSQKGSATRGGREGGKRGPFSKRNAQDEPSFSLNNTFLPKYIKVLGLTEIDNFFLKFYKAANKKDEKNGGWKFDLQVMARELEKTGGKPYSDAQVKEWLDRHMAALRDAGLSLRVHDVTFSGRLIVGLGGASVYETSLTLHHLYGVPYLPASSLKGMLAHYIVDQCFGGNEEEAAEHPTFRAIFGTLQERGQVVFFDAFPTKAPTLLLDVMNPHYAPYYMNGSAPADYIDPVPVPFFVVENATFRVAVGALPALSEAEALLDEVETHLLAALTTYGIGAKTAVGYGYASEHCLVSFPEEEAQR